MLTLILFLNRLGLLLLDDYLCTNKLKPTMKIQLGFERAIKTILGTSVALIILPSKFYFIQTIVRSAVLTTERTMKSRLKRSVNLKQLATLRDIIFYSLVSAFD